jgi:hypothetical protein
MRNNLIPEKTAARMFGLSVAGSCPMSAQPAGGRLDVGPKPYASAGSVKRSTRAQGDGVRTPLMIPDLHIYSFANVLIRDRRSCTSSSMSAIGGKADIAILHVSFRG